MRKIYIYTTETYKQKGWYKIGETTQLVEDRVKQQDGTSNPETLDTIYEVNSVISDKEIHRKLELIGYSKCRNNREWFEGFDSDDHVITTINDIISKTENDSRATYVPRFYQSYIKTLFIDKLTKSSKEKIDFALELAPRFGKTIWAIDLIQTLYNDFNYNVCVMPTYYLSSLTSFKKEFYNFNGYSNNMVYVTSDDNLEEVFNEYYGKKMIILEASLHMNEHESKLDILKSIPTDKKICLMDESDFGTHRGNSQEIIRFIDSKLNVYMTGTAIEKVINPLENIDDNIIRWSYTDMLMVKKGEHPVQDNFDVIDLNGSMGSVKEIIEPTFMRLSLGSVIDKFESVPDDYKTDWSKLLSDVKKSKGILTNLIKGLFGTYGGTMECLVDINTYEISPKDVTMVFANTKDKKEQKELVNVFKESLGTQYEVVLINGDETSNRKAEEKTKKIVSKAKRDGKKVVLVSKDMGSRSYSIPEIDTVILMFDRGSYATISQKISRVLTPGKTYHNEEKKDGYIISLSLDPNREDFNPIDEYFVYEGEKVDSNELSEGIKKVLRSMNILVNDNGELTNIELDKYSDTLINSSSLIRLGKSSTNPDKIMVDGDLITLLTGIEIHKGNKESDNHLDGIDSSKVNRYKGDDKEKSKKEKEEKKKVENVRDKIRKHIENIVDNIVEISEINNCESDDIIECLNMIKEKGYNDEVVFEVDIDADTVKKIILMGGVSRKLLNTIITSYNKEENSLLVK